MLNSTRIQTLLALEKLIKSAEEINLKIIKEPENTDRDYFLKTAQFAQHMLSSCCYYEDNRKKKIGFFRILPSYDHNPVMRILTDDYGFSPVLSLDLDTPWHIETGILYQEFLEWILCSFAEQYTKEELQWYCVDVWEGGKSFGRFSQIAWNCKDCFHKGIYTGDEELLEVLQEVEILIKTNLALMQGKYNSITEYNLDHNKKLPHTILVICDISSSKIYELENRLHWIQENASQAGIHIIMSSRLSTLKNPKLGINWISLDSTMSRDIDFGGYTFHNSLTSINVFRKNLCGKLLIEPVSDQRYEQIIQNLSKKSVVDTRFENHSKSNQLFTMDSTEVLRIPFAIDDENQIQYLELGGKAPAHGLMSGTTGSGKSVTLHTIIQGITMNYHPDDVEIWAIDYKAVEFNCYVKKKTPHIRVIGQDNSIDFSISLLDLINKEYEKRKRMMISANVNSFSAFRSKYGTRSLPRIFIIIDEFHNLTQAIMQYDGDKDYRIVLENLLKETRAMGITFFFCSQIISSGLEGLTDAARNQIGCRLCMLQSDLGEVRETLALPPTTSFNLELLTTLSRGQIYYKKVNTELGSQSGYELNCYNVLYTSEEQRSSIIDTINGELKDNYNKKEDIISRGSGRYPIKEKEYHTMTQFVSGEDYDEDELTYFFAAPKSLEHEFKVTLSDEEGSNVLLIGENDDLRESIVMHSVMSLLMDPINQVHIVVLNPDNDDQLRLINLLSKIQSSRLNIVSGTKSVLDTIASLKQIKPLKNRRKIYFWYGMNKLKNSIFQLEQEKETGTDDILTTGINEDNGLSGLQALLAEINGSSSAKKESADESEIMDYKEYVKILQNLAEYGPDNGYYNFSIYNQVKLWMKAKIDRLEDFEHRIGLRMSTDDAYNLYGTYLVGDGIDEKSALYYNGGKYGKMLLPYSIPDDEWINAYNERLGVEE